MTIPAGTTPGGSNDVRDDKNTSAGRFDADYSRASIKHPTGDACEWDFTDATIASDDGQSIWVHFATYSTGFQDIHGLYIKDSSDDWIFRVEQNAGTSTNVIRVYSYNDAQAEVNVDVTTTDAAAIDDFDIELDVTNDIVRVYYNGVQQGGDLALDLNRRTPGTLMHSLLFRGSTQTDNFGFSQMIVAYDENTIGWKVKDINPDAAGNHTAWTGAYTDVNENQYEPTDENTIVGAGSQSYTYDDVQAGIQTGQEIKAVVVATVAAADTAATAPNVQNFVRTNSTDYNLGSAVDVEDGDNRSAIVDYMLVNPDTSAQWTFTDINAAEFGFKSSV